MTHSEWLDKLPEYARPTERGARIDLRLYVYPDGHGNIQLVRESGHGGAQQPVDRPDEALDALRRLWERAAALNERPDIASDEVETRRERGRRMADALEQLANRNAFSEITDPVAWQRETRQDRPLPTRDS